ncbi:MAG: type VI secretion protein [Oscillospiraceae bacterium]|nr:type VI secretion protein [Oscillospiraceae bacterium]
MDKNDVLNKMRQERFVKNNGCVLRAVNILREKYVNLSDLMPAISDDITESEYIDCVNYLSESEYIQLRNRISKENTTLADTELRLLEGKLTPKGIQLLSGRISDVCVER